MGEELHFSVLSVRVKGPSIRKRCGSNLSQASLSPHMVDDVSRITLSCEFVTLIFVMSLELDVAGSEWLTSRATSTDSAAETRTTSHLSNKTIGTGCRWLCLRRRAKQVPKKWLATLSYPRLFEQPFRIVYQPPPILTSSLELWKIPKCMRPSRIYLHPCLNP